MSTGRYNLALLAAAVLGGGVALGISHATGQGHGHDAAEVASGEPASAIRDEMQALQVAYDRLGRAAVLGDTTGLVESFHAVHARKAATEAALASGAARPPLNGDQLEAFKARDEAFHASIEAVLHAAESGDAAELRRLHVELGDACVGCHAQFRGGVTDPALARADAAATRLAVTLRARVVEEMGKGGPPAAIRACSEEAPALAATIRSETGVELGRPALRLRNPANAAPEWVDAWLREQGERPAAGVSPVATVVDGKARVIKPIIVDTPCLACHGSPDTISPEVRSELAARYPADAAIGYATGDLRGALWAEVAVAR